MENRRKTKQVFAGSVPIGGDARISVQSMTNTDTGNFEATIEQINALAKAGCEIVRMSIYSPEGAANVRALVDASPVPLVADVHFDHRLAITALENGIHKLRINPGNIGGEANVKKLTDCLKAHHVPVRIGVNGGSIEKDILRKYGGVTAQGMVESALSHARMLERNGFDDIVLSLKASKVRLTVEACRLASKATNYPLHVGVTEAGPGETGFIKSVAGIGALLVDGIGDTIRVSLPGSPIPEVALGIDILRSLNLRNVVDIVACPTCGRAQIDVASIAEAVREATKDLDANFRVAVMGCAVNGPGEAREADIGLAGGKGGMVLFVKGQLPRKVEGDPIELLREKIIELMDGSGDE